MTLQELDRLRNRSTRAIKVFRKLRDKHAGHRSDGECLIVHKARMRMVVRRTTADIAVNQWIKQGCVDTGAFIQALETVCETAREAAYVHVDGEAFPPSHDSVTAYQTALDEVMWLYEHALSHVWQRPFRDPSKFCCIPKAFDVYFHSAACPKYWPGGLRRM